MTKWVCTVKTDNGYYGAGKAREKAVALRRLRKHLGIDSIAECEEVKNTFGGEEDIRVSFRKPDSDHTGEVCGFDTSTSRFASTPSYVLVNSFL